MFPRRCERHKEDCPREYFGFKEVPPYFHAECDPGAPVPDIVETLRSTAVGSDLCGFIDRDGIHYHIAEEQGFSVDLSREFVFFSQPGVERGEMPLSRQTLRFLMEPSMNALFVGFHRATVIRKTPESLELCKDLDLLWDGDLLASFISDVVASKADGDSLLPRLMNLYEEPTYGTSTEMWNFWDVFWEYLLRHHLKLRVETISW
jgi:hypothetical protein